jgi:hypothetical protein
MTIPSRTVYCACDPLNDMGENANGMNRINRRIYIDAQTSPMLSGLLVRVSAKTKAMGNGSIHIGVLYTFNRSRPFRLALTNVGPSAGTR